MAWLIQFPRYHRPDRFGNGVPHILFTGGGEVRYCTDSQIRPLLQHAEEYDGPVDAIDCRAEKIDAGIARGGAHRRLQVPETQIGLTDRDEAVRACIAEDQQA